MTDHPTLAALSADLASGRTTARKLVEACLARIDDPAGEGARALLVGLLAAALAEAAGRFAAVVVALGLAALSALAAANSKAAPASKSVPSSANGVAKRKITVAVGMLTAAPARASICRKPMRPVISAVPKQRELRAARTGEGFIDKKADLVDEMQRLRKVKAALDK